MHFNLKCIKLVFESCLCNFADTVISVDIAAYVRTFISLLVGGLVNYPDSQKPIFFDPQTSPKRLYLGGGGKI